MAIHQPKEHYSSIAIHKTLSMLMSGFYRKWIAHFCTGHDISIHVVLYTRDDICNEFENLYIFEHFFLWGF